MFKFWMGTTSANEKKWTKWISTELTTVAIFDASWKIRLLIVFTGQTYWNIYIEISGFKCLQIIVVVIMYDENNRTIAIWAKHIIFTNVWWYILTMRIRCPIAWPGKFLWKRARTEPVLPCNRVTLPQMARTRDLMYGFCGTALRVFALNTYTQRLPK